MNKIAIVGRPNVGKSALFNRIAGKRIAIVDEAEGITRDRIYAPAECFGRTFTVVDTGGIDPRGKASYNEQVRHQALIAIEEADALIMVVDGALGPTALDVEVARILQKAKKPLVLAVNKIDSRNLLDHLNLFYELGIKQMVPISASHNWQIAELLLATLHDLPEKAEEVDTALKLAILGRPNVGKSSLVNTLLKDERCIVSPIAGTTRDSIDTRFTLEGIPYTLIDTAGIRRKGSEKETVDKFAYIRTNEAIERADICILMVDAMQGLTAQEKRIASEIEAAGKGCILLLNKWDLVKGYRMEHCLKSVEEEAGFLKHCPKLFISAKEGRNVLKLFPLAEQVRQASEMRVQTPELNRFIERAMQLNHPPMIGGKRLRIYYMAQIKRSPPTFILFVNHPDRMSGSYKKYLFNRFRETYGFAGLPLVFYLRGKKTPKETRDF